MAKNSVGSSVKSSLKRWLGIGLAILMVSTAFSALTAGTAPAGDAIIIRGNVLWKDKNVTGSKLIIGQSSTLTVDNCTVLLTNGIVVKQFGKLIVRNSCTLKISGGVELKEKAECSVSAGSLSCGNLELKNDAKFSATNTATIEMKNVNLKNSAELLSKDSSVICAGNLDTKSSSKITVEAQFCGYEVRWTASTAST